LYTFVISSDIDEYFRIIKADKLCDQKLLQKNLKRKSTLEWKSNIFLLAFQKIRTESQIEILIFTGCDLTIQYSPISL